METNSQRPSKGKALSESGDNKRPWHELIGIDRNATLISFVIFVGGAIIGACLNIFIEDLMKKAFQSVDGTAGLLLINTSFAVVAITALSTIHHGIRNEVTKISGNVSKAINETATYTTDEVTSIKDQITNVVEEIHNTTTQELTSLHNTTTQELASLKKEMLTLGDDVRTIVKSQTNLSKVATSYIINKGEDDPGYKLSLSKIGEAQKSILIIGDYSPARQRLTPPKERDAYLEAIEEKIETLINSRQNPEFNYTRIVQREKSIIDQMKNKATESNGAILTSELMEGDEQAYEHCKKIFEIKKSAKRASRVGISLRICEPIPNSPSILIVDEKYILFTIPVTESSHHPNHGYLLTHSTDGVLLFEDLDDGKAIASPFINLFRKINTNTINIIGIE